MVEYRLVGWGVRVCGPGGRGCRGGAANKLLRLQPGNNKLLSELLLGAAAAPALP